MVYQSYFSCFSMFHMVSERDQRFKSPDTDLGTRGKLLKKSLSSSLLCFFQSKGLMDAIATNLIR